MFTIKNVKISIQIEEISLEYLRNYLSTHCIIFEEKSNFLIIKQSNIFLFYKLKKGITKHINATKISSLTNIEHCVSSLKTLLPFLHIINVNVDNISSNYSHYNTLNIPNIITQCKDNYILTYNRERFPGLYIKFTNGTLILFHTGKIISLGAKTQSDLNILFENLLKIIL